jgi:hypothetical protein
VFIMPIDYSKFDGIGDSESDEEVEGRARLPKGLQGLSVEELLDYAKRREAQSEADRANSSPPDAVERKDEQTADGVERVPRRLRSLSGIPQYETMYAGYLGGLFESKGSMEFDEATGLLATIKHEPEHPFSDLVLRNDQAKPFSKSCTTLVGRRRNGSRLPWSGTRPGQVRTHHERRNLLE